MATIIGIRPSSFKGDNGETVRGLNIYYTYPLEKGDGDGAERVFMTENKLEDCGYDPQVGDDVQIDYNRFGKVAKIYLVD